MDDASSHDQNQRLAERIGQIQVEDAPFDDLRTLDDDLVPMLLAYRQSVEGELRASSPETARRLWTRIEAEMDASDAEVPSPADRSPRSARRPDREPLPSAARSTVGRAVVGLALLLVMGVVVWWAWPEPTTGLVAESGSATTTYETPAGDVVRLRPHSQLYRASPEAARFRLEGEALFEVTPRADASFAVEADGAVVRVLGTRFTVQTWTPRPTVFLDEGRVQLRSVATGDTAALRPGETGTLAEDGTITVRSASADAYVDWLDGRLTFDSQPAATVAAELEQHYDIRLRLPDSIATQTLTGRLLLDDRSRTLDDFGRVLGGRFESANGTYRFRPD
jgi:ferric-dicitrate binding protein FerR (iron transport regulator)